MLTELLAARRRALGAEPPKKRSIGKLLLGIGVAAPIVGLAVLIAIGMLLWYSLVALQEATWQPPDIPRETPFQPLDFLNDAIASTRTNTPDVIQVAASPIDRRGKLDLRQPDARLVYTLRNPKRRGALCAESVVVTRQGAHRVTTSDRFDACRFADGRPKCSFATIRKRAHRRGLERKDDASVVYENGRWIVASLDGDKLVTLDDDCRE